MSYHFDQYVLDPKLFELRHDGQRVPMEPQVFDVLTLLVSHHDRVVTKDELMETVWGDKYISEAALNSRVMSARKAIGDTGRDQRLIRTIHGRGYRFVGDVREIDDDNPEPAGVASAAGAAATGIAVGTRPAQAAVRAPAPALLGREEELAILEQALDTALTGQRQCLLISGEAGLGKTSLVQSFLGGLRDQPCMVAIGQCLDYRGEGEPYMPVLDAIGRLCRGEFGDDVLQELDRVAPTWLVQMPAVVDAAALESLQRRTVGVTRDRMLREIVDCLESLSRARPLVLVLEDLHWSDLSTLDLLSILARRSDEARLLLIATFRQAEIATPDSPFASMVRELALRGYCRELRLEALAPEAVLAFAETKLGANLPPSSLAVLTQRTGGNPLYMTMVLDAWQTSGGSEAAHDLDGGIPESLRAYVEQRLSLLSAEERSVLDAASVVGKDFSAAAVAAALELPVETVEAVCEPLARAGRFIAHRSDDEWPDGTISEGYSFLHDLYEEVLYDGIPAARNARLHQRIGARLEAGYAGQAAAHASELALHYSRGRVAEPAVRYLHLAANQALQRIADQEALELLNRAMEFLGRMPEGPERDRREVALRLDLARALIEGRGWSAPEVEEVYKQALVQAQRIGSEPLISDVLYAMATMYEICGDYEKSAALMGERLSVPAPSGDRAVMESCELLACSEFHRGMFDSALEHAEMGLSLFRPSSDERNPLGEHPGIGCYNWSSLALWFLGFPDRALQRTLEALQIASTPEERYSAPLVQTQTAFLYQLRNEPEEVMRTVEAVGHGEGENGHVYRSAYRSVLRGWAHVMSGEHEAGIEEVLAAMDQSFESGAQMDHPYYQAVLADCYREAGQPREGLAVVEEALDSIKRHRSFFYEAELLRLKALLMMDRDGESAGAESRRVLDTALETAQRQGARPLALRVAVELLKLDRAEGKDDSESRERVSALVESYEEGQDTPDLIAARALL